MHNFPHGYASGWYQIGWSGEFPVGTVRPLRYFDTEMVGYRTEDGTMRLSDAFCPHLGAHLGHGGEVEGDCLVCPFHGWKWDGEGRNVDIPYSAPERMKLRIPQWEVREVNGVVMMWYGVDGAPASWEPPSFLPEGTDLEADYWPIYPSCTHAWSDLAFPPQLPAENAGDAAHFRWVHKAAEVPDLEEWEVGDHWFRTTFSATFGGHAKSTWATPKGPVEGRLGTTVVGMGLAAGLIESFDTVYTLQGTTPVDEHTSDHRGTLWVPKTRGDGSPLDESIKDRWAHEQFTQHARDFPVWENMTYVAKPPFAKTEATAFRALRNWIEDLYPDHDGVPTAAPRGLQAAREA